MDRNVQVCVLGLGYIGLPTAAVIAARGISVLGVDIDPRVVETVNNGCIHIVEPDLDMLVRAATQSGTLRASTSPEPSDVFIIAVPTPLRHRDGSDPAPCIDYVMDAARSIVSHVRPGNLVIVESTSPVGTTERVGQLLAEGGVDLSTIHLAYCPERVLPGRVLHELVANDRVIGGIDEVSSQLARDFYALFVKGNLHTTNCRTAEMVKLTENACRDVNIAFANELSMICDDIGIDVYELIRLANHHPRINILMPGCGVGGHCIAVDPWFIVDMAPDKARMVRQARLTNDYKSQWVLDRIRAEYRALKMENPVVAVLGLTFKPDIDDLRSSPALRIALDLVNERDAQFKFVEPNIKSHDQLPLSPLEQAVAAADLVVILVAHREFREMEGLSGKPVLDFTGACQLANCGCLGIR